MGVAAPAMQTRVFAAAGLIRRGRPYMSDKGWLENAYIALV